MVIAPDVDHLEAAAAEVAGNAVGVVDAGNNTERGEPRLFGARQHVDRHACDRFDGLDEFGTVRCFARRRRRQHMHLPDAKLTGDRLEAADRSERRGNRLRVEPPARLDAAGETAQLLFVEERRRRA